MKCVVKDVLVEAGRYDDVIDILNGIISELDDSTRLVRENFDVTAEVLTQRVSGKQIKSGAKKLISFINGVGTIDPNDEDITVLYKYTGTELLRLHYYYTLYAVHREGPESKVRIEVIRGWHVLHNYLLCYLLYYSDSDIEEWPVPDFLKSDSALGRCADLRESGSINHSMEKSDAEKQQQSLLNTMTSW